jgi:hypothetical protein
MICSSVNRFPFIPAPFRSPDSQPGGPIPWGKVKEVRESLPDLVDCQRGAPAGIPEVDPPEEVLGVAQPVPEPGDVGAVRTDGVPVRVDGVSGNRFHGEEVSLLGEKGVAQDERAVQGVVPDPPEEDVVVVAEDGRRGGVVAGPGIDHRHLQHR